MIVLSQSIVLAPATNPLGTPIFGLDNLLTIANVVATSEAAGFPAINVANPATNLRWQAASATEQFLTVAIDQVDPVDYLAVAVHNFGSGQIPVSVEGASALTGSPPAPSYQVLVGASILPNNDPAIFRFTPQSLISIRLRMQAGNAAPVAAVVYVGKLLVAERGTHTDHVPINYGRAVRVTNAKSENGQFLGRIVLSETRQTAFPLRQLRDAWYREKMDPFIEAAKSTPFFFAWRPQKYPNDVGYCTVRNDPVPSMEFETGTIAIELQMSGVAV
jgi:hypothetical protein